MSNYYRIMQNIIHDSYIIDESEEPPSGLIFSYFKKYWLKLATSRTSPSSAIIQQSVLAEEEAIIAADLSHKKQEEKFSQQHNHDHGNNNDDESPHISESTILENIARIRAVTVEDIKVPYADLVLFDQNTTINDAIDKIIASGFSRYAIYEEDQDNVVGMVRIKDVMRLLKLGKINDTLQSIKRPILVISPSMWVMDLLTQMQIERIHLAMIIDEYGGIDGLVTIEDVIEEIVGEMKDGFDERIELQLTCCDNGDIIIDGRYELDELENEMGAFLTDDDHALEQDTIGGLICALIGRVPVRGEIIEHQKGLVFEILNADPRRITSLRIKNIARLNDESTQTRS